MRPFVRTFILLFLILIMAGCNSQPQSSIPASITMIDDFEDITDWTTFSGKDSQLTISRDATSFQGDHSLVMIFAMNDWAGIGKSFDSPEQWSTNDSLFIMINSNGSKNNARVELTDNDGERFEVLIPMDFKGWKAFSIPLSDFRRREDWQPDNAPDDGLTLTAVSGISISPVEKGAGRWRFDALGRIPAKQQ